MRFCVMNDERPVVGTDRNTRLGYCQYHQHLRTDKDKRSIMQKAMDKKKPSRQLVAKVKKLYTPLTDNEIGSVQSLINDLDAIFSKYIRLKYAGTDGIVTCFVCNNPHDWKKIQCGHYISRAVKQTRFLEENCYPQCPFCNSKHEEDITPFKTAIDNYKSGTTEYLDEIASDRSVYKFTQDELKQMIINYRQKVKVLETKILKP